MAATCQANRRLNSLTTQLGTTVVVVDYDDNSQLSLSQDRINGPTNGYPPDTDKIDDNDDIQKYFKVTKELYDKITALNESIFDVDEGDVDVEHHVPFNPSRYPDVENGSMYMLPPYFSPCMNRTHNQKHQKRKL